MNRLFIANRGEIAVRIARSAKEMGIEVAALIPPQDFRGPLPDLLDYSISAGSNEEARGMFLDPNQMVECAKQLNCDAVHPGYGFLSENYEFAKACKDTDLVFVGPSPEAIRVMGHKDEAKKLMESAGVPVVPGCNDLDIDVKILMSEARKVGYPVLIKAAAGGGGRGMRIVSREVELADALQAAYREAEAAFGNGRLLLEKLITNPRHIEVQVFADGHGNVIHMSERDCSVQRRHQKVIEESPSPFVHESMRQAMGVQALALSDAVDYFSAGTVEFIADSKGHFYFLEMNTRLQVEHPVTEMTKNIDIVELMLRIASGERLSLSQNDIKNNGWAIESRIYAEDVYQDFLPETGRIFSFMKPITSDHLRIDSGVREGDNVEINYDPMLAKVITWGKNRNDAIRLMTKALDYFCIKGVMTNVPLLAQISRHPLFVRGNFNTDFLQEAYPDGLGSRSLSPNDQLHLVALVASLDKYESDRREQSLEKDTLFRHVRLTKSLFKTECISLSNEFVVKVRSKEIRIVIERYNRQLQVEFTIDGDNNVANVERFGFDYNIFFRGIDSALTILSPGTDELNLLMPDVQDELDSEYLLSPMPGLLVSLEVAPAQRVRIGDRLAVVEAMKMENTLKAERDTMVSEVFVSEGQTLSKGHKMIKFKDTK